jgi:hypothetical protein
MKSLTTFFVIKHLDDEKAEWRLRGELLTDCCPAT